MKHLLWLGVSALALVSLAFCATDAQAAQTYYVANNGSNSWSGKLAAPNRAGTDGPFATLMRARDAARTQRTQGKAGGVIVLVRGGVYPQTQTLTLTSDDSGTAKAPTVFRGYKTEIAKIVGGREVKGWQPVTDVAVLNRLAPESRGKVMQADLRGQGITNYGEIGRAGWNQPANLTGGMELFFQNKPMQIARWPNTGFAFIADVPQNGNSKVFNYSGDRPARWENAPDGWLHGYWTFDWADSYTPITKVDSAAHTIITQGTTDEYGFTKGKRYYALNLLEELDAPGEWYCDRKRGILYFWPPAPLETNQVIVSLLDTPIVRLENTSHVRVENLTLEAARVVAVEISGGSDNLLGGCTIRNTGAQGVVVDGGTHNGVTSCKIYETGQGGILVNGGDRKMLTPGDNFADNNEIHDYSRWVRCYRPAAAINGAGNRISHNLIYNGPHNAIQLSGNDHSVAFNEVHDVCRETGDVGAFYMGRDWTMRGNVIENNFFHHLGGPAKAFGGEGFFDAMGVYLDDAASGSMVRGNVFYKAGRAILVGGGRDNTVENNLFIACRPSVHVDARGIGWAKEHIRLPDGDWQMLNKLKAVDYNAPPYSVKYPKLATLLDNNPSFAVGNSVVHNWCVGGTWLELQDGLNDKTVRIEDNIVEANGTVADRDSREAAESELKRLHITTIPLAKMGMTRDTYRKTLPPHAVGKNSEP